MGLGGIGGKNGDIFEGKYIEESLFTTFRDKGKCGGSMLINLGTGGVLTGV